MTRTNTAVSLAEAAKLTGKNKATVFRAIKSGKISAIRDENGQWYIEPGELERTFPLVAPSDVATMHSQSSATSRNALENADKLLKSGGERNVASVDDASLREWDALRHDLMYARAAATKEQEERERERRQNEATIDDLRSRLDTSEEERRKTAMQLNALLTDERAKQPEPPKGWFRRLMSA